MPMISVQIASEPDPLLTAAVPGLVADVTARTLRKDPAVTAVAVQYVSPDAWFVGGRPLAEHGVPSFFVDARVTDGTNTKDEKARYVAEMFAALGELLGGVHSESYVHADDVRADGYGYGGLTQERRYIRARSEAIAGPA